MDIVESAYKQDTNDVDPSKFYIVSNQGVERGSFNSHAEAKDALKGDPMALAYRVLIGSKVPKNDLAENSEITSANTENRDSNFKAWWAKVFADGSVNPAGRWKTKQEFWAWNAWNHQQKIIDSLKLSESSVTESSGNDGQVTFKQEANRLNQILVQYGYKGRKFRSDDPKYKGYEWVHTDKTFITIEYSATEDPEWVNWGIGSYHNSKQVYGTSGNDPVDDFVDSILYEVEEDKRYQNYSS